MIGFSQKVGRGSTMDKISAVLIFCILVLLFASGIIVYRTWISGEEELSKIETVTEYQTFENELEFNNDTSITNMGDRELWIRAKIIYGAKSEDAFEVLSEAVDEGYWEENNGWYYCNSPIGLKETTKPLIDRLVNKAEDDSGILNEKFRLEVEAVDEAWLFDKPCSGIEAFRFFKRLTEDEKGQYI